MQTVINRTKLNKQIQLRHPKTEEQNTNTYEQQIQRKDYLMRL